ncbi:MAG TPA: formate dehydrogenase subunit gamma [Burkholderiales bacterium]|nr:formate dehydrogenase subunit gamma [Burkholderiales bacterium]
MKPIVVGARLFAVAFALVLAVSGTSIAQQQESQQQRAQSQPGNNAPVWRDVRSGREEYTSVKGRETGVLVQTYGETWRQLKNGWITPIAGWLIAVVVVVIGLFFKWRGSIKVHGEPSGRLIERFTPFERYTHWVVAISFSTLGISGLVMMVGKYVLLPVIGYTLFAWLAQLSKVLHNFIGPVFLVSVLMLIVIFIKDNLPRLYDFKWFANLGGMISGEHVPSGRFNAGEKVWFWVGVVVLSLVASASGLVLLFPNFDQVRSVMIEANVVHMVTAGAVMAISLGHIYLGTIGLDGAYQAMRNGYVDETWAKEHHEYWYNDVKSGKVKAGRATGAPVAPQVQH